MRHLTLGEVVELHRRLLEQSGGASGIRDLGLLESALAQPHATFGGAELHPTHIDKAAALGFALIANHPFFDGPDGRVRCRSCTPRRCRRVGRPPPTSRRHGGSEEQDPPYTSL
jgi:hypothetical protein